MTDIAPGESWDLLRKLGLCRPEEPGSRSLPTVIESASGVVLIGNNNTVHVVERPPPGRRRRGKP